MSQTVQASAVGRASALALVRTIQTPFTRRTWAEFLYAAINLPLGLGGFVLTLAFFIFGVVLSPTLLGLPLIVAGALVARGLGALHRLLASRLLGLEVAGPAAFRPDGRGFFGWLRAGMRDPAGWRARAFLILHAPVALAAIVLAVGLRIAGLEFLFAPAFWGFYRNSPVDGLYGIVHHPVLQFGGFRFDSLPAVLTLAVLGIVVLLLTPWVVRCVVLVDQSLIRWLLGKSSLTDRVRHLEQSRAAAVDSAAARLRGIERDLHDGAQARMVAVAMKLGMASEKLVPDAMPEEIGRARDLVNTAQATAKEAIAELRDLVQGIHPPVLDNGLVPALTTLAARSPVPTDILARLPVRPSQAIEATAYFCVAELLANVAKHGTAHHAGVEIRIVRPNRMRLCVTDDGVGGIVLRRGSGLAGLTGRVQTVDGHLEIDSPPGGPTSVAIELPLHLADEI